MTERPDPRPAALYARVSSDRQDVDLSISAQLRALRDYAEKNNYLVAREYVDEAESGRVADRPQFRQMLDAASADNAPFDEILVWKFSRFTRKREHAVAFKSMLRRRGIRVISITEHADDSHTGTPPPASSWRRYHRERRRVLLGKSCAGSRPGHARGRHARLQPRTVTHALPRSEARPPAPGRQLLPAKPESTDRQGEGAVSREAVV